eukprot:gene18179-18429_t
MTGSMQSNIEAAVGSIAVHPEYSHLQIGQALRDFVHRLSSEKESGILEVVAMTRCSAAPPPGVDYLAYVESKVDPTIQFHVRGGAQIVKVVRNYRPADVLNSGNAVLIAYNNLGKENSRPDRGVIRGYEEVAPVSDEQYEEFLQLIYAVRDANSPEAFYENLCNKVDGIMPLPKEWGWDCRSSHAGLLSDETAESFDPAAFGLSFAEASQMDPHQRILLNVCMQALSDSGLLDNGLNGSYRRIGVFVGLCNNEWARSTADEASPSPFLGSAIAQSSAANRLSYLLGLTGPSLVVDTACSSSLTALHTAMNSIRCGDCDAAVIAAADLILTPFSLKVREAANMLSSDGKNKSFDASADGYVRGEGAGALVIMPLVEAERRRCAVLAVIRGSSVNQDGKSASFTAPNGSAQRDLLRRALSAANLEAEDIAYLEAHGTGTALGDPIEWGAIRDVLLGGPESVAAPPLVIGAVKSSIGHLEGAAGIAGVIKAVMALRHRNVPPNLHFQTRNPLLLDSTGRQGIFPTTSIAIRSTGRSKLLAAGVSCFGSGGTNAHVILSEYLAQSDILGTTEIERLPEVDLKSHSERKVAFVFAGQMAPTSFKYLPLGLAYHTSLLRSAAASFKTRVEPPERILSIDYWIEQMLSCVRFGACIETVKSDSTLKAIVEIGPSDALIRICMSWIDSDSIRFLSTLQGNKNCVESFNVAVENISSQINSAASALSTGTLMRWRWRRVNNGIDGGICSLDVDCDVLYEAWCDTVAEHEALRLSFDPFAVPSPTQRLWKYSSIEHLKELSRCSNWFKVYHFDSEQSDEQVDSCVQYGTSIKKILHSLDKYYLNRITSSSPYSDRNLMSSGAYFPAVMEDLNTKGPALVIDALDDE